MANRQALLDRLSEVVAAYGARPERWPSADRVSLQAFVAADREAGREAGRLVEEARAMDSLLDLASDAADNAGAAPSGLADRIMARVALEADTASRDAGTPEAAGWVERPDNVVAFPAVANRKAAKPETEDYSDAGQSAGQAPAWLVPAAMAASLMLGVFLGGAGYLDQATTTVTELAGLSGFIETTALGDDVLGLVEEDFL